MLLRNSLGKSGGDNEGGRDGETGVMLVCATVFYKKLVYKYELKKNPVCLYHTINLLTYAS